VLEAAAMGPENVVKLTPATWWDSRRSRRCTRRAGGICPTSHRRPPR
jgi:hypothetical protein